MGDAERQTVVAQGRRASEVAVTVLFQEPLLLNPQHGEQLWPKGSVSPHKKEVCGHVKLRIKMSISLLLTCYLWLSLWGLWRTRNMRL